MDFAEFIGIIGVALAGGAAFETGRRFMRRRNCKMVRGADRAKAAGSQGLHSRVTADPSLRQNLRVKFLYDEAKIDRVIEFERQRSPGSDINQLMRSAIERWERDNR
jgi:hypothetical protein